jgi:AhpD family alkylhydroperoxidase
MTQSYLEITDRISRGMSQLRTDIPDTMKAFGALAQAATRQGALDRKTKELIALALGVAAHCDGCIGFHVQALHKLGASRAEVKEALGMSVYMGGGPSLMYAAEALRAFDEMAPKQAAPEKEQAIARTAA